MHHGRFLGLRHGQRRVLNSDRSPYAGLLIEDLGGNRDIYIIRESGGERIASKVDLRNSDLFHSPYYYIQQNDVIYVTPSDRKVNTRSEQLQIYPYLISGTSIAMVILAFCI